MCVFIINKNEIRENLSQATSLSSARSHTFVSAILLGLALSITLAGCSSGSSDEPTANVTSGRNTVDGKIVINNIEYTATDGTIVFDDSPGSKEQLKAGMQLTVETSNGAVTRVYYREDLKGPIDLINTDGSLIALGQTVWIDESTRFDDVSRDALAVGDVIEVSGMRNESGQILATYIEKENEFDEYEVLGPISSMDSASSTFNIDRLQVNYSDAMFDDLHESELVDGLIVEVYDENVAYTPESYYLLATNIEGITREGLERDDHDDDDYHEHDDSDDYHEHDSEDPDSDHTHDHEHESGSSQSIKMGNELEDERDDSSSSSGSTYGMPGEDGEQPFYYELEAYITSIEADDLFMMGRFPVRITAQTLFRGGDRSQLVPDAWIAVKGKLNGDGELEALEIDFESR